MYQPGNFILLSAALSGSAPRRGHWINIGHCSIILSAWQQNMFAVRAEIEVGFRCDTTVFNKLTKAAG